MLPSLRFAVVMVQAEVAARMAGSPGTKDYGAYSVKLQLLAEPVGRFSVPRTCFLPPPRVDSAVIRLERRSQPIEAARLADAFAAAEAAFAQRRKTLRNSLRGALGTAASSVQAVLDDAGLDGAVRAETLPPRSFVALGAALRKNGLLGG
jgi:16S rRNA (adenine1518-N6/adenine1519-N6)-dimethyltransferase